MAVYIGENQVGVTRQAEVDGATALPTPDKIAKFNPTARMNSADMSSQEVETFIDSLDLNRNMLDFFYPVGTYYETSDSSFNPNIHWGGTWSSEEDVNAPYNLTTNEQAIGTWVDGKTLYRKILSGTSTAGTTNISISNLNIENIVKGDIIIHNTTNNSYVFDSYVVDMTTDKFSWYVSADKSTLYLRSGTNYAFGPYYIILEYTRTTSDTVSNRIVRWHRTA